MGATTKGLRYVGIVPTWRGIIVASGLGTCRMQPHGPHTDAPRPLAVVLIIMS